MGNTFIPGSLLRREPPQGGDAGASGPPAVSPRGTSGRVEMGARGTVFRLWPLHDGDDHVEVQGVAEGVLLAVCSNGARELPSDAVADDAAVFLTVEELGRLAAEGAALHAGWVASRTKAGARAQPVVELPVHAPPPGVTVGPDGAWEPVADPAWAVELIARASTRGACTGEPLMPDRRAGVAPDAASTTESRYRRQVLDRAQEAAGFLPGGTLDELFRRAFAPGAGVADGGELRLALCRYYAAGGRS